MKIAPKIVIVAEDEVLVRMLAADTLAEAGFSVVEVATAAQAVAALQEHVGKVAVLFTDVHMPGGVTGLELARLVRRRWPHVAILVTSGQHKPGDGELPAGGLFITKPYRAERVLAHIQALVGD